jgi:hypothetical protein
MARRIAKSASRRNGWRGPSQGLPHFKIFTELPGAVFVGRGRPSDDDLEQARYKQRIRADYERTDCQATLWHELTRIGLGYDEIELAVVYPASLTNCIYGFPIKDWGSPESRYAAEVASLHID